MRFREEIHHAALPQPQIASGTMWVEQDGTLVRDQEIPKREISEIGQNVVRTRPAPEAEPTIFPIPDSFLPRIATIRLLLTGIVPDSATSAPVVETVPEGWRLVFADGGAIAFGCGAVPAGVEIADGDGVRRVVRFLTDP